MSASLIPSAPGRHRDSDVAPTGEEGLPRQEIPSSWKSLNLENPDSDNGTPGQAHEPAHNLHRAGETCPPRTFTNRRNRNENINAFNLNAGVDSGDGTDDC